MSVARICLFTEKTAVEKVHCIMPYPNYHRSETLLNGLQTLSSAKYAGLCVELTTDEHNLFKGNKMPTISIFYGIIIRMFFEEHAPPHFHAQ